MTDLWIAARGTVQLPDPRQAGISATVAYTDPATLVDYTASLQEDGIGGRLEVAQMLMAGVPCLQLSHQGSGIGNVLELSNRTGGDVAFSLMLIRTPFVVDCVVPAGETAAVQWDHLVLAVTVDGLTPAPLQVRNWDTTFVIELASMQGRFLPTLKQV
ncbi:MULTISPECIES: hypothetical protein [unclassified Duganella]|uniref:hypothetical protein n=1 Tax=unclassified Duganella TaxID=2636909 RepID=UPI00111452E1|nr:MULTISPECIES: hypothetical protein [unclassified Duganella]